MKFIMLHLDLLAAARIAPSHIYANMAESSMSLLNVALQSSPFATSAMPEAYERKMKNLSSMKVAEDGDATPKKDFRNLLKNPWTI